MNAAVALFAKAPVPGQVKTRLSPALSPDTAAAVYGAFVQECWRRLDGLAGVTRLLFVDRACPHFDALAGRDQTHIQRGADLGARMLACFDDLDRLGFDRKIIIGSDSPSLPLDYLQEGLEALSDADAVLGPAEDGGYYAVGCRAPHSEMFREIAWSTNQTLLETESSFRRLGWQWRNLPPWYDVDSVDDLQRLAGDQRAGHSLREIARRALNQTP